MVTGQLDLLAVVNHPMRDADRDLIDATILTDGHANGGLIDQGRVRRALTNEYGLMVNPRLLSARYSVLRAQGRIRRDGWHTNDDLAGGNAGKPAPVWRLTESGRNA